MGRTRCYTDAELDDDVDRVLAGEISTVVSQITRVPYKTIRNHVTLARAGGRAEPKRRGPPPLLPKEDEDNIFEWIVARQQVGHPVDHANIIRRASDVSMLMFNKPLTDGWYKRFMERHPKLTHRVAQSISKVRNSVDVDQVNLLFETMTDVLTKNELDPTRIFNVDETAFQSRKKAKPVVAVVGSSNVWSSEINAAFHMPIVACGSAAGFVVPPLFILPDKTVEISILDTDKTGAAVTTSESGFMNNWLFIRWLKFISESVSSSIERPLLLIMDGCSSHYSEEVVDIAEKLKILLVCLPANATHLFQPLDVAVFGSFKSKLRAFIDLLVCEDSNSYSIAKNVAVNMAGLAWQNCNFSAYIAAGFKGCGLYPLSHERMMEYLAEFKRNGVPKELEQHVWTQVESVVQDNILVVPPPRRPAQRSKKRVTVGGRLLTKQFLQEMAVANAPKKATHKPNKTMKSTAKKRSAPQTSKAVPKKRQKKSSTARVASNKSALNADDQSQTFVF